MFAHIIQIDHLSCTFLKDDYESKRWYSWPKNRLSIARELVLTRAVAAVASPPLWTRKQNYESCAWIATPAHVRDGENLIVEDTGSYLACNIEAMAVWVKKIKTTEKLKSRRRLTCGSVRELSCTPSKWVSNGCALYCALHFALYCARYFAWHCAAPEVAHVWFAILTSIENNNNNSNNKNNDSKKELKRQ